jgi:hypothetical protein
LTGFVRIDTVNPARFSPAENLWNLPEGLDWKELEFDGPASYPESPELAQRISRFFNLALSDDQEQSYRQATVLSIRLRYWYELRVPFANWLVFVSWFAANAQVALSGALDRPTLSRGNLTHAEADLDGLGTLGRGLQASTGYAPVTSSEMAVLWGLATGKQTLVAGERANRFFLPLTATYSMRLQSSFHRKWLMPRGLGGGR